jgi:tetratricopeptide (TPR) repeat protein
VEAFTRKVFFSQGAAMAHQGKQSKSNEGMQPASTGSALVRPYEQSQLDFELDFFGRILERHPDYVDILRVQGNNLTLKGRFAEGLQIDKRLVHLRPDDPLAHYNLACSYALLKKPEQALKTLRRAVELGYRDFRYMREDRDLDSIRHDPRFRQLLREFEQKR